MAITLGNGICPHSSCSRCDVRMTNAQFADPVNTVATWKYLFHTVTSGYATWFTAGGAIRIAHYDVTQLRKRCGLTSNFFLTICLVLVVKSAEILVGHNVILTLTASTGSSTQRWPCVSVQQKCLKQCPLVLHEPLMYTVNGRFPGQFLQYF